MQKIETVDMPRSEALASGQTTLGELSTTMREDFRNRLIWGDNWGQSPRSLWNSGTNSNRDVTDGLTRAGVGSDSLDGQINFDRHVGYFGLNRH